MADEVDKKERKLLDDIERRTHNLQERIHIIETPVKRLPAWMNLHAKSINAYFAQAEQLNAWLKNGQFDEIVFFNTINRMLAFLDIFHKEIDVNRRLFYGEIKDVKKASKMLVKIERKEILLSGMEGEIKRNDILLELGELKKAEKKFNQIIGQVRLFTFKLNEIGDDMKHEIGLYIRYIKSKNLRELKKKTRVRKIEVDITYIRNVILPSDGIVQKNFTWINNTLHTLRAHVAALKSGATFTRVPVS